MSTTLYSILRVRTKYNRLLHQPPPRRRHTRRNHAHPRSRHPRQNQKSQNLPRSHEPPRPHRIRPLCAYLHYALDGSPVGWHHIRLGLIHYYRSLCRFRSYVRCFLFLGTTTWGFCYDSRIDYEAACCLVVMCY